MAESSASPFASQVDVADLEMGSPSLLHEHPL